MGVRILTATVAAAMAIVGLAGCAKRSDNASTTLNPVAASSRPGSSPPTSVTNGPTAARTTPPPAPTSQWPTPEDCISYDPTHLTVAYANGTYTVSDGSHNVIVVPGQTGDQVGAQSLALAQRYTKHCFLGRDNARQDQGAYVFDYWRGDSGQSTLIPGEDNLCSDYNRHNLTVEDLGGGDGWRVKDHDHVLHLFDNGSDAHNGALVLSKYSTICFIGAPTDSDSTQISYLR